MHADRRCSLGKEYDVNKYLRDAALLPNYDGGNMGMQRRRVHGLLAHESFNPRATMDAETVYFQKSIAVAHTYKASADAPVFSNAPVAAL